MDAAGDHPSFRSRRLPAPFSCLVVVVAPGRERAFDDAEWRDAIVLVVRGEIGLCGIGENRRYFSRGAVLCLDGLALRCLHNPGRKPAVLLAVSRRGSDANPDADSFPAGSPSH
jgi:hypothetical protein